ncbi:MAG: TonB-dependent receptor, partial [Candidatus Eremiobacteraeota bacterium]|nr:TonB-dependent receptor [Candidatus Eremiobacteraeota bacterium]
MKLSRHWLFATALTTAMALLACPAAWAGSTGNINGTVLDGTANAPLAGAAISATSPTGTYRTATDKKGFYSIVNMSPDSYTLTASAQGFEPAVVNGVQVFQDQTQRIDLVLHPAARMLARVPVTAARTNLVQPTVTSNTYNVTSAQMATILNDSTHHTLYDVLWRTPGITSGPTSGSPIIRGGINTELGWEFEEIPIIDRTVGYYVTELSTTGIGNVEVTTGGLSANQGGSNGGVVNMVVKQGSYPGSGHATFGVGNPTYQHGLDFEYGSATPTNSWSWFVAGSYVNNDQSYGTPGVFHYELVEGNDFVNAKDNIVNVHHRWGANNQNDLQYVLDNGVGLFRFGYGGADYRQLSVEGVSFDSSGNEFALLLPKGHADSWYHWYNVQKLAFSHTINDRSYYRARIAQSQNGYIFDEKWGQNYGEPCLATPNCTFAPAGGLYNVNDIWCYGCYYQDRHQLGTYLNFDYANQFTDKHLLKFGAGYEFDKNYRKVANFLFNTDFGGNWPDYRYVTQAPTNIYSLYLSDHFTGGKWILEPGIRWDLEHYAISPIIDPTTGLPSVGTQFPFSNSFVSPRFAVTYQADQNNVFRASYGYLGQFIGTAYAEDFSIDQLNPPGSSAHGYFFNGGLKPSIARSYDASWEHQFPHGVSLRLTPYIHNNDNYVVEYRPPGSVNKLRPTLFTNGAATRTRGVELGVSREVPVGLSTFFSFTYNDTKSNVIGLAGPFFGGRNSNTLATIAAKDFEPASYAAPWSS